MAGDILIAKKVKNDSYPKKMEGMQSLIDKKAAKIQQSYFYSS